VRGHLSKLISATLYGDEEAEEKAEEEAEEEGNSVSDRVGLFFLAASPFGQLSRMGLSFFSPSYFRRSSQMETCCCGVASLARPPARSPPLSSASSAACVGVWGEKSAAGDASFRRREGRLLQFPEGLAWRGWRLLSDAWECDKKGI